jgi:putative autotransporter adhesin-like protein
MRHSYALSNPLRTFILAAVIPWAALGLAMPAPVVAQTAVPLAPFRAVTLRGGGKVILRYAPSQRVTLLKGSANYTGVAIAEEGRLVIDRCQCKCPRGYELEVEVLTPELVDIMVSDGGTIQSRGSFPRQAELGVAVHDGGTIDLRSMTVDAVDAAVRQGGRIFTKPQRVLAANVAHGGAITYWGHPRVTRSVEDGGVVARGTAADADKPLPECGPAAPPVPPVPPTRVRVEV